MQFSTLVMPKQQILKWPTTFNIYVILSFQFQMFIVMPVLMTWSMIFNALHQPIDFYEGNGQILLPFMFH